MNKVPSSEKNDLNTISISNFKLLFIFKKKWIKKTLGIFLTLSL